MNRKAEKSVIRGVASSGTGGDPIVVDSKDGRIIRIRPLHWDMNYTEEELAGSLWEFEARGKTLKCPKTAMPPYYALAYKTKVYSKDRVKYPLKRVDWEPGGDPDKINAQNRGKSKFVRISWDEAIDIMESEIRRMYDTYGPSGILAVGEDGHKESKVIHYGGGCHMRLFKLIGGYTREVRTPDSVEGYYWGGKHVWGSGLFDLGLSVGNTNIVKDVSDHTEMIVLQAGDWETTQNFASQFWSTPIRFWLDLGIKMVVVDPFCSYTAVAHDEVKWIPIEPNTDAALDFAIMYVWLTEGLYDKEYVETHTTGFEKLASYVLGEEDGIPKTPAWASEICGVPTWTIKALARKWGKVPTSIGHFCGAHVRGPYSHEPGRTEIYKLAMQGIGKPGVHQIHMFSFEVASQMIPSLGGPLSPYVMGHADQGYPSPYLLPRTMIHHAIEKHELSWWGSPAIFQTPTDDQFVEYHYPNKDADGGEFHMIWSEKASNQGSWNGGFKLQDAFRNPQIEFFVSNHQWLQGDSIFADLVLPLTTCLEEADTQGSGVCGTVNLYGMQEAASDAVGESMSDYQIAAELAKRFGVYEEYTEGRTVDEEIRFAYDTSLIKDMISWEDLKTKQYFIPPFKPDWQDQPSGLYGFYVDPENNPLNSESGKIDIYSEKLAMCFPDDKERQPMAHWIQGGSADEGWTHDETRLGERAKKYPLLLNTSPGRWRVHTQNDDIVWLREIPTCKIAGNDGYMYEPCWITPEEAAARGISDGDIVKVFNDQGIVLAAAKISERLLPHTLKIDKGAHPDPIAPHIDRGGCTNLISPPAIISKNCAGFAVTGFLVDVAKLEDAEMEQWKKGYPDAFERCYDPASGASRDGWVEGAE